MNIVSLSDICDLQNGFAFKSDDYIEHSNTLNCRMSNIRPDGNFDIEYNPKYLPDSYTQKYKDFLLKDGDIVIAMTDMANDPKILGVPTIVDTKGYDLLLNQRVGKLIFHKKDEVDVRFLQYSLNRKSVRKYYTQFAGGGLQLNVGKKEILSVKIPLPPLPQQQKIANILDAADALRQNDKALIAKYDELTQALFLEMFGDPVSNPKGWEKVELKKLCSFKKKNIKPEDIEDGEKYVALDSIEKVTGNITTIYNVEKGELKSNKFWFDNSYILYGKLRPYLNKVALPNFEGVCSTDIIPIQAINTKSNRLFITSILRHNSFVSFADERSSGANLPRISPSEVEKYSTINPPIELQNQFAERVAIIEEQKAIAQKSLEKSEELFNSLLQRAFKGELA